MYKVVRALPSGVWMWTLLSVCLVGCADDRVATNPFAPTAASEASRRAELASLPETLDAIERVIDTASAEVRLILTPLSAMVSDPEGDGVGVPGVGSAFLADLVSASVSGNRLLKITVEFGRFHPSANVVAMSLDAGADSSTGFVGTGGLGTDTIVWMGKDFHGAPDRAVVERWNSALRQFVFVGSVPQLSLPEGALNLERIEIEVPRLLLGKVIANAAFRMEAFFLSPFASRPHPHTIDAMPNHGVPPARLAAN